jgi:hypothetical protein
MKKSQLPSKICPVCQRPFAWRKKWSRDWDQVIYCSDACRKGTPRGMAAPSVLKNGLFDGAPSGARRRHELVTRQTPVHGTVICSPVGVE